MQQTTGSYHGIVADIHRHHRLHRMKERLNHSSNSFNDVIIVYNQRLDQDLKDRRMWGAHAAAERPRLRMSACRSSSLHLASALRYCP